MLVLCMILTLLPINTAYADEADAQKDANQVEEVQSDEDIVMQTEQVEEVKPDESVAMQETVKPAVRMLAPAAVSPAASPEKIKEIELNLKPVTEITNINDFKSITYSPSDKMTLKEVIVYEGYDKVTGPIASVYNSDKAYTVMYDFEYDKNAYSLDSSYSKVKINSKYIQDWNCKFRWGCALQVYVSYPSLKDTVGVTFKPRDQWSGKISSMYVGHNLGAAYDVWLNYYNGLNQIDKSIGSDAAYDPTKDYSVCITIAGKGHATIISPDLTKDDVTINYGTIWKVAWDDDNSYTKIYVNFPREEDSEYTVKAKNAEITNEAGEPVSKAKAGTVLTVKLKDLEKGYAFEKWSNDDADHWHECTDAACTDKAGSVKDKAGHVYDDDADTTCNVCGYVRTVTPPAPVHTHTYGAWSNDDADHWQECTDAACTDKAGSVKDKAGHAYDDDADTTCNVCGYVRTVTPPAPVHTHTYGAWSSDDADHWHECTDASCTDKAGSVKDKAGHVYDDAADTTCNVCGYVRTVTPPAITPDYKFLEGANGKWTKSSDKNLAFRANGEFSKFTGVKVDGTKIDADKYTAVSGSTIVNLKKEYLETLSVGKHTLTVVYTDGECSTEFEIKAASTAKKDTTDKENKSSKSTAAKLDNAKTPKTGDSSNILLWFTLLFSSGVVLMGKAFANKKRKQDR